MKIAFYTLGCKVNQYDTQMMKDVLEANGHTCVPFTEPADFVIINTCTVTGMSDRKSRQIISRAKQRNKEAGIVVCGCFSQVASEQVAMIPNVDIVLGTANRKDICKYLKDFSENRRQIVAPADLTKKEDLSAESIDSFSEKSRAILKIEDGCRNFCSYCIIPFARGPIRSKTPDAVIREAARLCENGYREIVLTGIHLASYGADLPDTDLCGLLERLDKAVPCRIRLGSLEPNIVTPRFTETALKCRNLMPSFHLSLQSGSDTVLARMNRKYTTAEFENAVGLLRSAFPDAAITTDIIVGFPGETEEEFKQTLSFAERISFAKIHIFPYSARQGTKAAAMNVQISPAVKSEREKRLAIIEQRCRLVFMQKQVGKTVPVLFERKKDGLWEGHTPNYQTVFTGSDEDLEKQIRDVRILSLNGQVLDGCLKPQK